MSSYCVDWPLGTGSEDDSTVADAEIHINSSEDTGQMLHFFSQNCSLLRHRFPIYFSCYLPKFLCLIIFSQWRESWPGMALRNIGKRTENMQDILLFWILWSRTIYDIQSLFSLATHYLWAGCQSAKLGFANLEGNLSNYEHNWHMQFHIINIHFLSHAFLSLGRHVSHRFRSKNFELLEGYYRRRSNKTESIT